MATADAGGNGKPAKAKAPPRLPKPDRPAFEARVAEIQAQCDAAQAEIDAIKTRIDAKKNGRRIDENGAKPTKNKLQEVRDQFKAVLSEKNAEKNRLAALEKAREGLRGEIKVIKDKLPFTTIEKIDEEIKRVEDRMSHSSLSLNEEKRLLAQIQTLSKSKDQVKEYATRMEKLSEDDAARKASLEKIKEFDSKLNAIKEKENEQKKIRDAERSKAEAEMASMSTMFDERNKHYQAIKDLRKELKEMRTDFKAKEDEYYAAERAFNSFIREEKKRRWEAVQEERRKRDEERKQQQEEMAPNPFDEEIITCDQLYHYVKKWIAADKNATSSEVNQVETMLEGMVLKKRDDQDDPLMMGLSTSKGGKKSKKSKQEKQERLVHTIDVITSFHKVGVEVPSLASDCPQAAEVLLQKKEHYKAEQEAAIARKKAEKDNPPPETVGASDEDAEADSDVAVQVTVADAKTVAVSLQVAAESGEATAQESC